MFVLLQQNQNQTTVEVDPFTIFLQAIQTFLNWILTFGMLFALGFVGFITIFVLVPFYTMSQLVEAIAEVIEM